MKPLRPYRTLLLLLLAASASPALTQTAGPTAVAAKPVSAARRVHPRAYQAPFHPDVILLDPAHGGSDAGGMLRSDGEEKDFDLAFALRLEGLLTAKGFTVVLTHSDTEKDLSGDQRVELANRSRAVACLLIHASAAGHGVHLFTSSLTQSAAAEQGRTDSFVAPWDSAQAGSLPRSLQLANELATALNGQRVPLVVARASVAPIDSLVCPAVAIEIAPAPGRLSLASDAYQQQVANSVVTALTYWRQRAQNLIAAEQAAAVAATPAAPAAAAIKPRPKPKPVTIQSPDEVPLEPYTPAKPAPIVRRPPASTPLSTPPGGVR